MQKTECCLLDLGNHTAIRVLACSIDISASDPGKYIKRQCISRSTSMHLCVKMALPDPVQMI